MTIQDLRDALTKNIRDYGMYIALFVIMAIFTIATQGLFLSPRNIADLMNQTGYIAVLAVGMTLVIVIRHIDLSVGFLAGFLGAVSAVFLTTWHLPVLVVIPAVLILGTLAGLLTALPVARLGIPSFVASLAGWLIFRGLLLSTLSGTGTIQIADPTFIALGNGSIPDFPIPQVPNPSGEGTVDAFLPGLHKLTLLLGLLAVVWFIVSDFRNRKVKKSYNFAVIPNDMFILKQVFVAAALGFITWNLAGYNGMGWTVVIMLVVVVVYDWVSRQTVLGRHIYAVGGNPEAAELSGIGVARITMLVFGSMGFLCGLAGILFASRLQSAGPTGGTLFELDAIAAAYIGGVSAAGGVGKITGSMVGALVYMSLRNGMNLMGVDESLQYIIRGAVLALAVIFDVTTRRVKR
ncbi:MAG: sugar ABC transporter permease [Spirochaetota bacterium]